MKKLLSGTQAAKIVGVGNNLAFVKHFVETKQIAPVKFPGAKRKKYVAEDVARLIDLNKKIEQQRPAIFNEIIETIKNKHLRS